VTVVVVKLSAGVTVDVDLHASKAQSVTRPWEAGLAPASGALGKRQSAARRSQRFLEGMITYVSVVVVVVHFG
jgi:hypothetical protein